MLLHINGKIVEIRPGELFQSKTLVKSRYLSIIPSEEKIEKKRKSSPKKSITNKTNVSSST